MEERIRDLFPALKKFVYLNSAAVAPLPVVTVEAVLSQLKDVCENGVLNYTEWIATKEKCRSLVAEMLSVRPEQIAFMRNTSDGFSAVANGLTWQKDDNIVTFQGEFPSNFYAWKMIRDRFGVELRVCPSRNGRIDLTEFVSLIDKRTKLVAISVVQFDTGFRSDLEYIGKIARSNDALFAVDIIQGFGAIELDLPSQLVDIASGSSHKWLCAPEGCGILYLSDRARERLTPSLVGWISVENHWDFAHKEQSWKPNALAFESGTGCASLFYGLKASLELINQVGIKKIEAYLEQLTDYLCELAKSKGYEILSSRKKEEKSQIVLIAPKQGWTDIEIAKHLQERNIIISPRSGAIRVAPHFFNNQADIETFVETLSELPQH